MDATIRHRRETDLDACVRVLAMVHSASGYPINWPEHPAAWLDPVDSAAAWVVVLNGDVAGHVCLTNPEPDSALWVERLFVSPDARGQGLGEALLRHASDWATQRRRALTLEVADNCGSAIALYRRLGWREKDRIAIDWGGGLARHVVRFDAPDL